ncbi:hypothetical protein SPRG_10348 [Saprolegnia parasitica CBS 223.65]|uniref:Uncharacterized protein n=1 Tax=Saprolegnia parasitica (strain CBS 223.65) TaxID=695850 RepID=A0A067C1X3_SAPPC|nr:hypothetical protein SPRG_10348 [Saprolegnia parasitica CBS 223.65]KDO24533.1 hypothetical protein SPRG_10348 [Saprolegnia parasitica CBS 223.65]|eukprot:XP_012204795.1 hypothetical protein SPRG_10348 [Saprolegnia parasitica CBS 223.65]
MPEASMATILNKMVQLNLATTTTTDAIRARWTATKFTCHTFRRSGAQHRLMNPSENEHKWTLSDIKHWAGWAEGESNKAKALFVKTLNWAELGVQWLIADSRRRIAKPAKEWSRAEIKSLGSNKARVSTAKKLGQELEMAKTESNTWADERAAVEAKYGVKPGVKGNVTTVTMVNAIRAYKNQTTHAREDEGAVQA